jgi:structure-specific endonuclease subunit SLX1
MHFCYILKNTYEPHINRTYNGYTINPINRLRQHNQEIKGGAKYTSKWGNKSWEIYVLIRGFPDYKNALQCEWKIKHPARKRRRPCKYNNPKGRVKGLCEILKLDKWTSNSIYNNRELELEIWITKEYSHLLEDLPENIKVNIIEIIDKELIESITKS